MIVDDVRRIFGNQLIYHFDAGPEAAAQIRAENRRHMDDAMRERLRADVLSALHRGISEGADIRRPGADEHPYLTPEEALAAIEAAAEARGRESALRCDCGRAMSAQCGVCDNDE